MTIATLIHCTGWFTTLWLLISPTTATIGSLEQQQETLKTKQLAVPTRSSIWLLSGRKIFFHCKIIFPSLILWLAWSFPRQQTGWQHLLRDLIAHLYSEVTLSFAAKWHKALCKAVIGARTRTGQPSQYWIIVYMSQCSFDRSPHYVKYNMKSTIDLIVAPSFVGFIDSNYLCKVQTI